VLLTFKLGSSSGNSLFDVNNSIEDQKIVHDQNSYIIARTNSTPIATRSPTFVNARRTISVVNKSNPQYEAWHMKTQGLFRSLRLSEPHFKQQSNTTSNRLTSHHSSSSEEWYLEFQELGENKFLNSSSEIGVTKDTELNVQDAIIKELTETSKKNEKKSKLKPSKRSTESRQKKKVFPSKCSLI